MPTKYSDYIQIRASRPAYVIGREESGEWETFIPNEQFNRILSTVVAAVRNNDQDMHKSFWMDGTYGTGKSHAAAVVMHLLCDKVDVIKDYIEEDFEGERLALLRQSIYDLRQTKRLFPVNLYGQQNITNKNDFSPELQKAIKQALKAAGLNNFAVKTDFDDLANHVESEPDFWKDIIAQDNQLQAYAPDVKTLAGKLRACDTGMLAKARQALAKRRMDIRLDNANICDWFFEVQDKLVETTDYCGLLIIWDEFTDLMKSDVGLSLLVELQKITERAMETRNNSYFFFISHPSALNKLDMQERTKTIGRYHYMKYNMATVSAFKIMSRKFRIVNQEGYNILINHFFNHLPGLLTRYAVDSNNAADTENDLRHLFPMHPATANLATYYANVVGSSSRSVFEFIGANPAIHRFLDSEEKFAAKATITPDYLWDYVLSVFNEDHIRYGAVTERFNSYQLQVKNQGNDTFAVFKGILLLNALNNVANNESVTPSEDNIKSLFAGTQMAEDIDNILNWLNNQSIIQRAPGGLFSIQFSALPPKEIEQIKQEIKVQFKYTAQLLNYGTEVKKAFEGFAANVNRPLCIRFFALESNPSLLLHKIESEYYKAKGYELFLAMMLGRNDEEMNQLRAIARQATNEERFTNIAFFVFDATFGNDNYERFVEYMANALCAQRHNLADQQQAHLKNAQAMLGDWMKDVRRSNFTAYMKGKNDVFATQHMATVINSTVSPYIFNKGVETLEILRTRSPRTFWKAQFAGETAKTFLLYNTQDELLAKVKSSSGPLKFLLQDAVDENLHWKTDVNASHPLRIVASFVQNKIDHAVKTNDFNLAEKFADLARPPYGLYPSYAGIASLAFAMRPYAGKIFSSDGKPRLPQHLAEDVMEVFKSWDNGKPSNKVTFTFETKESGLLCKMLIKIFKLKQLKGYSDISSLKDARWALSHEYVAEKGYPLWALKYCTGIGEDMKLLIDRLVEITLDANINKNPALMAKVLDGMKEQEFDLPMLLNSTNSFEEGYHNYLKSVDSVALADDQIDAAKVFIKQHLSGEIGLWKESEVQDKLKDWKLSLVQPSYPPAEEKRYTFQSSIPSPEDQATLHRPTVEGSNMDVESISFASGAGNPIEKDTSFVSEPTIAEREDTKEPTYEEVAEVRRRIAAIENIAEAKDILTRLCDMGYSGLLSNLLK